MKKKMLALLLCTVLTGACVLPAVGADLTESAETFEVSQEAPDVEAFTAEEEEPIEAQTLTDGQTAEELLLFTDEAGGDEDSFFDVEAGEEKAPEDADIFQGNPEDIGELFLPEEEEILTEGGGSVPLDQAHFPDKKFLEFISSEYDADGDGILSTEEISGITKLDICGKEFSSLKGIEYFTELGYLDCSWDNLTELDVSGNTKLKTLYCDDQSIYMELDPFAPQVSLADLVGRENLGRITLEEGYEMDESGVVSLKFAPDTLRYYYDTGFNGVKMSVTIYLYMGSIEITVGETITIPKDAAVKRRKYFFLAYLRWMFSNQL